MRPTVKALDERMDRFEGRLDDLGLNGHRAALVALAIASPALIKLAEAAPALIEDVEHALREKVYREVRAEKWAWLPAELRSFSKFVAISSGAVVGLYTLYVWIGPALHLP